MGPRRFLKQSKTKQCSKKDEDDCTPEINITLYVNYTAVKIKKKKDKYLEH